MSFRTDEDGPQNGTAGEGAPGALDEAAQGTLEKPLAITDPRMMRGLAHPARIAIYEYLAIDGPATATECAEIAHLSPSACSYHLRALARYGFVEEDPQSAADGRHRPWRARLIALKLEDDPSDPAATRAAKQLLQSSLESYIQQERQRFYGRQRDYPAQWQAAAGFTQNYVRVTAAEMLSLRREMEKLTARYWRQDPAERPGGAQRVMTMIELIPAFDPEGVS